MDDIEAIRQRIIEQGASCLANDNIAPFLREGDLDIMEKQVAVHMAGVLKALLIDADRDHNTRDTARRIARMFVRELFAGRYRPEPELTEFPNVRKLSGIMVVGPMDVRSTCSHHFAPMLGKAWIGVAPGERILGLSKFARIFDWFASRPQIQEELAVQVADYLEEKISPAGVAIKISVRHACMSWRGVKDSQGASVVSVMRGLFDRDREARREFLELAQ